MKGVVLAGGSGSRLAPITRVISKHLLPVYDRPLIYFPIGLLMQIGIRDILIVSTPRDVPMLQALLGDGAELGLRLDYAVQAAPRGIVDALLTAASHVAGEAVCVVLGDNIFLGEELPSIVRRAIDRNEGCTLFGVAANNPSNFGVAVLDDDGRLLDIVEKPPPSPSAVVVAGLYVYDANVVAFAREIAPSARGETEVTELNRVYLAQAAARLVDVRGACYWADAGTPDALAEVSARVACEVAGGGQAGCLEAIAYTHGYISAVQLRRLSRQLGGGSYALRLNALADSVAP